MKSLCWIVGSAYSGSTLLTALLDRNPFVTAVGELAEAIDAPGGSRNVCWKCRCHWQECSWWNRRGVEEPVYDFLDHASLPPVVVDSSKDPVRMRSLWERSTARPPVVAVHLSKSPIEQVGSYYRHQTWRTPLHGNLWSPQECVDQWIATNAWYHGFLTIHRIPTVWITYSDLAHYTDHVLETICCHLGIDDRRESGRSHTLGGNPGVIAAASGDDQIAFREHTRDEYLDGKYSSQTPELNVTYDDSWKAIDPDFYAAAAREIDRREREILPLMRLLGHAPVREAVGT